MLTVAPVSRHTRATAHSMPRALGRIPPDLRQAALWSLKEPKCWQQLYSAGEKGRGSRKRRSKRLRNWHGSNRSVGLGGMVMKGANWEPRIGWKLGPEWFGPSWWARRVTGHSKYVLGCLGTLGARWLEARNCAGKPLHIVTCCRHWTVGRWWSPRWSCCDNSAWRCNMLQYRGCVLPGRLVGCCCVRLGASEAKPSLSEWKLCASCGGGWQVGVWQLEQSCQTCVCCFVMSCGECACETRTGTVQSCVMRVGRCTSLDFLVIH